MVYYFILDGNHRTLCGNIISNKLTTTVLTAAKTIAYLKSELVEILLTLDTAYTHNPTGGDSCPIEHITVMKTPNQRGSIPTEEMIGKTIGIVITITAVP